MYKSKSDSRNNVTKIFFNSSSQRGLLKNFMDYGLYVKSNF